MKNPPVRCARLLVPLLAALVLALGGCSPRRSLRPDYARRLDAPADTPRATSSVESPRPRAETGPGTERAVQVGRYILFRLHWTRADDMAATLAPILQARYGPGAAVVPHVPSNTLIFR